MSGFLEVARCCHTVGSLSCPISYTDGSFSTPACSKLPAVGCRGLTRKALQITGRSGAYPSRLIKKTRRQLLNLMT